MDQSLLMTLSRRSVSTMRQARPCPSGRAFTSCRPISWHLRACNREPHYRPMIRLNDWVGTLQGCRTRITASPRNSEINESQPLNLLEALIFDCDGVIVESEDIHRRAYNATFEHFQVVCPGQNGVVEWTEEFYDMLQNKVGGGKPKMRWYFGENGWPSSSVLGGKAPKTEEEQILLIDTLQDWKTEKYKDIIGECKYL